MQHSTHQLFVALTFVSCLIFASCEESDSDSTSSSAPPPSNRIDHPAQSSLGKAKQSADRLKDQIDQHEREVVKQANEIYGDSQSEDEPASEPEAENE